MPTRVLPTLCIALIVNGLPLHPLFINWGSRPKSANFCIFKKWVFPQDVLQQQPLTDSRQEIGCETFRECA